MIMRINPAFAKRAKEILDDRLNVGEYVKLCLDADVCPACGYEHMVRISGAGAAYSMSKCEKCGMSFDYQIGS